MTAIKPDIHLASISGGTDIVSCFVLGIPTKPVWRGEIQGPGLGMAVDVYDEDGHPVARREGRARLHAAVPLHAGRCSGTTRTARNILRAYFERFPGIWAHGDFAEWTEHGGIIIHGRSDATLNPGGVRIGTAEIYAQVEAMPEVLEALAIGQDLEGDVRVVLFVRLAEGVDARRRRSSTAIKQEIRTGASPRHVPAKIDRGRRHPAHQVRQDHRARRARHRAWAGGEEQRGAGEPGGAGALPGAGGAADLRG